VLFRSYVAQASIGFHRDLNKKNSQLVAGMKKQGERTIDRRKTIVRLATCKTAIQAIIGNLPKKPTIKNFQSAVLAIQNILSTDDKAAAQNAGTAAEQAQTVG